MIRRVPPVPMAPARPARARRPRPSPEEGDAHQFPIGARSGAQSAQLRLLSSRVLDGARSSRSWSGVIGSNPTAPVGELFDPAAELDRLLEEARAADQLLVDEVEALAAAHDRSLAATFAALHEPDAEADGDPDADFELLALIEGEPRGRKCPDLEAL
jgi:hypothetical protein